MARLVVVVRLPSAGSEEAGAPLPGEPPVDLEATEFDRYAVSLTGDEAIFVFEGRRRTRTVKIDPATMWSHAADTAHDSDAVTYAPTPGPGDSDGGDVYAP